MFCFTGNPLICNCAIIWLKSWLSESSSIGPKCADGTYVKGMPFSRNDCPNISTLDDDYRSCTTHENEALLPNLATSQVFSSLDKIKDYATQIKNNYQTNKINGRPSPEESDYFYDDYVDYPLNETVMEGIKNEIGMINNRTHDNLGGIPVLYAGTKNTTHKKPPVTPKPPGGGFTFFGMPLPAIDVGKFLNTGRKIDWPVNKHAEGSKIYQVTEAPKFETGGFTPMLPTTSGGFMPIPDPTVNMSKVTVSQGEVRYSTRGSTEQTIMEVSTMPTVNRIDSNTTKHKIKSEIHELEAFVDNENSTHVAYNRTKNIEEQKIDPNNLSKYNLMESNVSITRSTEKEGILITTDTTNDISQSWMESSTMSYSSSTSVTSKPPIKKHIESQPTALSAVLIPKNPEAAAINYGKRPATITKVNMPHVEHNDLSDSFAPVSNREAKTRFSDSMSLGNTRTRQVDGKEWYYKNYNNTNLEPYVAPGVHSSSVRLVNPMASLIVVGLYYYYLVV